MRKKKRVKILHIGCGGSHIPFDDVDEIRLDINPNEKPDIICDICDLKKLDRGIYDGVWAKHILEHVFECKVPTVLQGIIHVLKKDGFLLVVVPDLRIVMKKVVEKDLKLDDLLYTAFSGVNVKVLDIIYGHHEEIERLNYYQSHKTGFDIDLIIKRLREVGFQKIFTNEADYEVRALACKSKVPEWVKRNLHIYEKENTKKIS